MLLGHLLPNHIFYNNNNHNHNKTIHIKYNNVLSVLLFFFLLLLANTELKIITNLLLYGMKLI